MILENMSLPSAGATASNSEKDASSVTVATNDVKEESKVSKAVSSSPPGQNVNAINSNTFIMNLEPSGGTGNTSSNTPNKTNLLRLFNENGNRVKTLGIGRIVINRTLLKSNTRTKPKVIRLNTTRVPVSKAPIQLHVKDKINLLNDGKKDDDISGNLANFMNFKFSGLVPTPMKTESPSKNIFKVNLKPPEITLPQVKTTKEPSSHSDGSRPVSPEPKDDRSDDELTSLSWLTGNDKNLLKTLRSCNPDDVGISLSGDESEEEDELDTASNSNAVFTAKSRVDSSGQGGFATRQYGQPYSPNGKPPYSFSCLIFMAVEDSKHKMLPVKEIYAWVCKHFPYFQTAPSGWKNSIRHNLSLNKCFKKVDQPRHSHDPGKGSLWCIDPAYRPNLIQALKRTPFYPYLYPGGIGQPLSLNNLVSLLPTARSGKIPLWSPSMTPLQPSSCYDPDVESAALNLIGLKGNDAIDKPNIRSTIKELAAEIFSRNEEIAGTIPLVISDPADDHTYSGFNFSKPKSDGRCQSPESDKSAPDAAYEFETCGTDLESDAERLSNAGSDSECDLADSGFVGLKGKRGNVKGKRKGGVTTPSGRKKSRANTKSSSKSTQTPPKKALKVRFRSKKTRSKPIGEKSPLLKNRKRKATPPEGDDALTSDVDSGKDSPKVTTKTRRRTPSKKVQPPPKKKQKRNIEPVHKSPYGTRSSTMTRQTRRRGISEGSVLQRAAARKRRQDSVSYDSEDDEEIKLAAGSLLHLAGIRSQA